MKAPGVCAPANQHSLLVHQLSQFHPRQWESQWRARGIGRTWPACCLGGSEVSLVSGLKATVLLESTMLSLVIMSCKKRTEKDCGWTGTQGQTLRGWKTEELRGTQMWLNIVKQEQHDRHGQTAVRTFSLIFALNQPCLKKRSSNTWNQQGSDCQSTFVKSHTLYSIQMDSVFN